MKNDALKRELFLLVGYLLTSAHGLYKEPHGYGPFRLLDAAGRLLALMQAQGLSDPFLKEIEGQIEKERFGASDDQGLQKTLDQICLHYAEELKQRIETEENKT